MINPVTHVKSKRMIHVDSTVSGRTVRSNITVSRDLDKYFRHLTFYSKYDEEIRAAVRNASEDISRFEREFRILDKGEAIVTASYRDLPLVIKIPLFDDVFERDKDLYKQEVKATAEKDMEL